MLAFSAAEWWKLPMKKSGSKRRAATGQAGGFGSVKDAPMGRSFAALEQQALQYLQAGDLPQAEAIYQQLIAAGSRNYAVYSNLAVIHGRQGRNRERLDLLRQAVQIGPQYAETHYNLGNALRDAGNVLEAIASYQRCGELNPKFADAPYNQANVLRDLGEWESAIRAYQRALECNPGHLAAWVNLGNVHKLRGDVEPALQAYRQAVQLDASSFEANLNLGVLLLLAGEYATGWQYYEWRAKIPQNFTIITPSLPPWQGPLVAGARRLLLVGEQGLGDTLQFVRYALHLRQQGMPVAVCVQAKLAGLIRASMPQLPVLTPDQIGSIGDDYAWMPLLSLPRHLQVSPSNPLVTNPYVHARDALVQHWREKLAAEQRPIIGINWQGNPVPEQTHLQGRSLPLECFAPLAAAADASLLALQKGHGSEQLESCSFRDRFVRCQSEVSAAWDFQDTAAILANCDLVISSDTSVAHLAAALGRPTWLLVSYNPDWRWGLTGETSFWYPSMRLFRQAQPGQWDAVIQAVIEALRQQGMARSPLGIIRAPISLGELVDKITILQIKAQQLRGAALTNVSRELQELEATFADLPVKVDDTLINALKQVNQRLWQIEDSIREHEHQQNFGDSFVGLARSVYQQNDQRAAIKKSINTRYGSQLVEEKSYQSYQA